jgi:hypothetical protein
MRDVIRGGERIGKIERPVACSPASVFCKLGFFLGRQGSPRERKPEPSRCSE